MILNPLLEYYVSCIILLCWGLTFTSEFIDAQAQLGLANGAIFAAPIPEEYEAVGAELQAAVEQALQEAEENGVNRRGKEATPWLLKRVGELTAGKSLASSELSMYFSDLTRSYNRYRCCPDQEYGTYRYVNAATITHRLERCSTTALDRRPNCRLLRKFGQGCRKSATYCKTPCACMTSNINNSSAPVFARSFCLYTLGSHYT